MAQIIAIANPRGGAGRTATALHLSLALAGLQKKVLAVDLDPQGALSLGLGIDGSEMEETIATGLADAAFAVQRVVYPVRAYLDLLPANIDLAAAEMAASGEAEPELQLRRLLEPLRSWYDFMVVDCPRNLGLLTANALCASQEVLIPVPCEPVDIRGTRQALQAIERLQAGHNRDLQGGLILPIVPATEGDLPPEGLQKLRSEFGDRVLDLAIQQNDLIVPAAGASQATEDNVEDGSSQGFLQLARILTAQAGEDKPL